MLRNELITLTDAVREGQLQPPPSPGGRAAPEVPSNHSSLGPQVASHRRSEPVTSFGLCTREENRKVFISKESAKSEPGNTSPGSVYDIKGTFGQRRGTNAESSLRRAPRTVFGTDPRDSALLREYKARAIAPGEIQSTTCGRTGFRD